MGLRRGDNRMARSLEVFGCVAVFGGVTASNMATRQARTQMDPPIAERYALRADVFFGRDVTAIGKMLAKWHW